MIMGTGEVKIGGVRAARLAAIKADIDENLGRPDLCTDAVAARSGVSGRYVRMLFAGEGQRFSEFVLERRLTRAHLMLTDAQLTARTISSIAFEVGFADLSYFNRTFRRRFGTTPTDVREQARRARDVSPPPRLPPDIS